MLRHFEVPFHETLEETMNRLGYKYHCSKDGRLCYHREIDEDGFPRFHAYVTHKDNGIEIDLHFDAQDTLSHKGNHDQSWAYEGGRLISEMQRIKQICNNSFQDH